MPRAKARQNARRRAEELADRVSSLARDVLDAMQHLGLKLNEYVSGLGVCSSPWQRGFADLRCGAMPEQGSVEEAILASPIYNYIEKLILRMSYREAVQVGPR